MSRQKLPDRRLAVTQEVVFEMDNGRHQKLLVTLGFDREDSDSPREVFCASFKAGTAMNGIVMDACVLMSRLLQHGVPAAEIAKSLAHPPTIIGTVAQAAARFSR